MWRYEIIIKLRENGIFLLSMVGRNLGVQSVRTLAKLSSHAQSPARLFPNEDLAADNPLGQCQREQQNSFTVALDPPPAPGAQGSCARGMDDSVAGNKGRAMCTLVRRGGVVIRDGRSRQKTLVCSWSLARNDGSPPIACPGHHGGWHNHQLMDFSQPMAIRRLWLPFLVSSENHFPVR